MEIRLSKKPKNPIIIEGFPGFGLVGTIATEFLIEHLKTVQIGSINSEELPAMAIVHGGQMVRPLQLHYNAKHNLVILQGLEVPKGQEWKLSNAVMKLASTLNAKEIISLEGIGSSGKASKKQNAYYYTSSAAKKKKFERAHLMPLSEGIIIGISGALLMTPGKIDKSALFAETASNLPDSKAAAKIIEVLNNYLGLKIDPKPLLKQAEQFEDKLKGLIDKSQQAIEEQQKKNPNYFG